MKLYFSRGACSLAVRILINELSINCDYIAVDIKTKKTEVNGDYYQINPKGAVPALETDDGAIITEGVTIHQYLADQYKATNLCPPIGDIMRYHVLSWSNYITTELHKNFSLLFNPTIPAELKQQIFIPALQNKFSFVDKQVAKHDYITGNTFSLPDAYLFVMLLWGIRLHIDIKKCNHLTTYFEKLKQRPSIKQSLEEEGIEI